MSKWSDEMPADFILPGLAIQRASSKLNESVLHHFDEQLRKYFTKVHGVSSDKDIALLSRYGQIKHYVSAIKREFYFKDNLVLSVGVKNSDVIIDTYYT